MKDAMAGLCRRLCRKVYSTMKQIISASVTPFGEDGKLDLESAARLYELGLSHELDGFFILGSMGEWALLTEEEKCALAECALCNNWRQSESIAWNIGYRHAGDSAKYGDLIPFETLALDGNGSRRSGQAPAILLGISIRLLMRQTGHCISTIYRESMG